MVLAIESSCWYLSNPYCTVWLLKGKNLLYYAFFESFLQLCSPGKNLQIVGHSLRVLVPFTLGFASCMCLVESHNSGGKNKKKKCLISEICLINFTRGAKLLGLNTSCPCTSGVCIWNHLGKVLKLCPLSSCGAHFTRYWVLLFSWVFYLGCCLGMAWIPW